MTAITTQDIRLKRQPGAVRNFLRALFVDFPEAVGTAVQTRNIYNDLVMLDAPQLAALGIDRSGISRFAATRTGIIAEPVRK